MFKNIFKTTRRSSTIAKGEITYFKQWEAPKSESYKVGFKIGFTDKKTGKEYSFSLYDEEINRLRNFLNDQYSFFKTPTPEIEELEDIRCSVVERY